MASQHAGQQGRWRFMPGRVACLPFLWRGTGYCPGPWFYDCSGAMLMRIEQVIQQYITELSQAGHWFRFV